MLRSQGLRFIATFLVILGTLQLLFYFLFLEKEAFYDYLRLNASIGGWILGHFEAGVQVHGLNISSHSAAIRIGSGCGGLRPLMIFVAGVLAFPASTRNRIYGLILGSALLLAMNLLRVITLFYAQALWPQGFDYLHLEIWPAAFIFISAGSWLIWVTWTSKQSEHATA